MPSCHRCQVIHIVVVVIVAVVVAVSVVVVVIVVETTAHKGPPPPIGRIECHHCSCDCSPLVNGRSTAAAAVLLPPALLVCFYGCAALAMYQLSMRKRRAGSSAMTDALSLDQHNDDVEAQHGCH
jgi:hypothetical protein